MRGDTSAELPSGIVAFLFTDITGSTRLARDLGDRRWAELLGVHHAILRQACSPAGHGVRTEGDSHFVVFESASEALRAAVDAQGMLEAHEWPEDGRIRVRIGVHVGEALVRDGDYVGYHVHRARRICDAAPGGEVVVSDVAAGLLGGSLPHGTRLVDLGLHRLKDLGEPQRLFGVEAPGREGPFPPVRSLEAAPNNLPVQRSAFIGRADEIARVLGLLEGHRLVTLTGVGGCGKTRLALQVGAEDLDRHPGGVFFVDLAALADPALVPHAAAEAIGLRSSGGLDTSRAADDLLVDALARTHCLLVVDNCEHLRDACAQLAERVLGACPGVRILATSREVLEVEGEQVHRVRSLSLPGADKPPEQSEAVELFVDRAKAAWSDFVLAPGDVAAVAQLCRRLDGIPLAIEFAAARVTHLSIRQIAERLDDRFRLLSGGQRRVRRQQTLEAALDWSYDLLDEHERTTLRCLGVFSGDFGVGMVEEICSGAGIERAEVLDLLRALVEKSLVGTEVIDGEVRYRLLETVRSYAEARSAQAGELDRLRSGHRDAYLAWLESMPWDDLFFDTRVVSALARELSNLRAALEWSRAQGRHDLVGRLAARPIRLWVWEGRAQEGRRWLEWALEESEELDRLDRAVCHVALATALTAELRGPEMETHAARAVELGGEELGGLRAEALGLQADGTSMRYAVTGDPGLARQARALAEEAIRAGRTVGGPWPSVALLHHGFTMWVLGDLAAAERSFAAVVEESPDRASPTSLGASFQLAVCRNLLGDHEGAVRAAQWGIDAQPSNLRQLSENHLAVALARAHLGQPAEAAADLETAIRLAGSGAAHLEVNDCLLYAAAVAYEAGDPVRASRLLAAAVSVGEAQGALLPFRTPAGYMLYQRYVPLVRAGLDPEEARRHRDDGRALSRDEAVTEALGVATALRGPTSDRRPLRAIG